MNFLTIVIIAALIVTVAIAAMGIFSAAKAMQLDFIEVGQEEYDFAVPVKYLKLPEIKVFIEQIREQVQNLE